MFKVKFTDTKFVRGIFEAISAIITETRLIVNPAKGISLTAIDGSHICLVDLFIHKEDCLIFESKDNYELGLNLDDLVKIIKRGSSTDEITFLHDPKEKKLIIEMKAENAKKARKFTLALIDLDVEVIDVNQLSQLPFVNCCQFNIGLLDEAIKDAEIFAEVLQIKSDKILQFSAEGTMGDMQYDVEPEELISHEFTAATDGSFAIVFLKNILKIVSITSQVAISLKSESPVRMHFSILNQSSITYYLAPRVEEDSDSMYEED
jgi:proliferating cell nuclear antigen